MAVEQDAVQKGQAEGHGYTTQQFHEGVGQLVQARGRFSTAHSPTTTTGPKDPPEGGFMFGGKLRGPLREGQWPNCPDPGGHTSFFDE